MSGRIRSIKPEWLEDELMSAASSDARVLSIALILMADDYGNGRCHKANLSGRVFPPSSDSPEDLLRSYTRFAEALEEVLKIRFVGVYEVNGQHYFTIRKWKEHQKVNHPGKPLVPVPPEDLWKPSCVPLASLSPDLRPTTNDQRPTTNDQRPTTNDQRPTTNDQRPTTSASEFAQETSPVSTERPKQKPSDPLRRQLENSDQARKLFDVYRVEANRPNAQWDRQRQDLFQRLVAEDGLTEEQIRLVMAGAKLDEWAQSQNLSASHLFKTADTRERLMALARDPPRPKGVKNPRQPNAKGGFGEQFLAAAKGANANDGK
jgi:hypothetical protein